MKDSPETLRDRNEFMKVAAELTTRECLNNSPQSEELLTLLMAEALAMSLGIPIPENHAVISLSTKLLAQGFIIGVWFAEHGKAQIGKGTSSETSQGHTIH